MKKTHLFCLVSMTLVLSDIHFATANICEERIAAVAIETSYQSLLLKNEVARANPMQTAEAVRKTYSSSQVKKLAAKLCNQTDLMIQANLFER